MTAQTHTTTDLAAKWADALDRLRAAEAASEEYVAATGPIIHLSNDFLFRRGVLSFASSPDFEARLQAIKQANPAYFLPDYMEAEANRLARAVDAIALELMAMPAPDAAALEWKFAAAARDGFEWEPEHLAQLRADMDALLFNPPAEKVAA